MAEHPTIATFIHTENINPQGSLTMIRQRIITKYLFVTKCHKKFTNTILLRLGPVQLVEIGCMSPIAFLKNH